MYIDDPVSVADPSRMGGGGWVCTPPMPYL